jgi:hypothetical protein
MAEPSGTFFILCRDRPNFAISVPNKSKEVYAPVLEEPFTGGKKQQWVIDDGVIRNVNSGLVWTTSWKNRLHQDFYRRTDTDQRFSFQNNFWMPSRTGALGHYSSWQSALLHSGPSYPVYGLVPSKYDLKAVD